MGILNVGLSAATLALLASLIPQPAEAGSFRDEFVSQLRQFDMRRLDDGLSISVHACSQAGRRNHHRVVQDADINIGGCVQVGDDNKLEVMQRGGINLFRYRQRGWRR